MLKFLPSFALAWGYVVYVWLLVLFARRPPPAACRPRSRPDPDLERIFWKLYEFAPLEPFWVVSRALSALYARRWANGRPMLELGTQSGVVSEAAFHDRVVDFGSDVERACLAQMRRRPHFRHVGLINAERTPFDPGAFSTLVMLNAIYHTDREACLREFRRILRPGGVVVLTDTPRYDEVLPLPWITRWMGLGTLSCALAERERARYHVRPPVTRRWWTRVSGWNVRGVEPFASLSLCRLTRPFWNLQQLSPALEVPRRLRGWMRRSRALRGLIAALYRDVLWPRVCADPEQAKRGAMSVAVMLEKPA